VSVPMAVVVALALLVLAAASTPNATAAPVSVWQGPASTARPCSDPNPRAYPKVTGGCVARARAAKVAIIVRTAFGDLPFATCTVHYALHIDRSGRTWIHDLDILGPSPCNDAVGCWEDDDEYRGELPWRGRIETIADGRLRHRTEACLDTCMGRFEGRFTTILAPAARGWRARPSGSAMIGTSGWKLDGAWRMPAAVFDVRPAGG
jgi:hypothetical protein